MTYILTPLQFSSALGLPPSFPPILIWSGQILADTSRRKDFLKQGLHFLVLLPLETHSCHSPQWGIQQATFSPSLTTYPSPMTITAARTLYNKTTVWLCPQQDEPGRFLSVIYQPPAPQWPELFAERGKPLNSAPGLPTLNISGWGPEIPIFCRLLTASFALSSSKTT